MARINSRGYIERKTVGTKSGVDVPNNYRDWWLVTDGKTVNLQIQFRDTKYLGKRIKFKVEVIEWTINVKLVKDMFEKKNRHHQWKNIEYAVCVF